MSKISQGPRFDSTLALVGDPYRFISKHCRNLGADLFETRLGLRKAICMSGPEAARLFYDSSRFMRHGAMPKAIQKTLLGQGGVQGLDDEAHRHRKQLFMTLMTHERIEHLLEISAGEWQRGTQRWASMQKIMLYTELHEILMRAVCAWAGLPLAELQIDARTRDTAALFDHAGSVGFRHLWSRWARKRVNHWMEDVIEQTRGGRIQPPERSAAHSIAWHRDLDGKLLPPHIAAVELINVIRPTVAVSVYIVFVAHALLTRPDLREKLSAGADGYRDCFVQEVRRYYPFFPAVAARTRKAFEWNGYRFPEGRRVFLDLYGTNHDPRTWERPEQFEPERFRQWDGSSFNFLPQGGGDHHSNHRCPGEWFTVALMKQAADIFTRRISYHVPEQDLRIDWSRLPALPRSGFVMTDVREN